VALSEPQPAQVCSNPSGSPEVQNGEKLSTIDFYADLIPLLKQKYSNDPTGGVVEADGAGKITP
jgi:hypothetical protein